MNWRGVSGLVARTRREDRVLMVYVTRGDVGGDVGPWLVSAFETAAPDTNAPTVDALRAALDAVFDDHAHANLPPVSTLAEALSLGERYANWWLSSRASHFDCACEDISARAVGT